MNATLKQLAIAGVLVAGAAACSLEPDIAPQFTAPGTGTVTGQVFFDANDNKVFDPAAGDSLITDAEITLSQRGDSTKVVAQGTAGAGGSFSLSGVPIGTYDVRAQVAGGQTLTCAPTRVTVYVGEQAFASQPTRISCRIDIAVAKTRPTTSTITISGIVTAAPGVYRATNMYLQDFTGGIQAFNVSVPGGAASQIAEGDSVEITTQPRIFNNEIEAGGGSGATAVSAVTRIVKAGVGVPAPQVFTIPQLKARQAAAGDTLNRVRPIGELITIRRARIVLPVPNSSGSGTDGRLIVGTDTLAMRLDVNVNTNVSTAAFMGPNPDACYDVTGILGIFNQTLQLKPRRLSDRSEEVPCTTTR